MSIQPAILIAPSATHKGSDGSGVWSGAKDGRNCHRVVG